MRNAFYLSIILAIEVTYDENGLGDALFSNMKACVEPFSVVRGIALPV